MDSQTAVVFVLVTILTFLFALRKRRNSDIEHAFVDGRTATSSVMFALFAC